MDVKVANTHMNWKHGLHLSYWKVVILVVKTMQDLEDKSKILLQTCWLGRGRHSPSCVPQFLPLQSKSAASASSQRHSQHVLYWVTLALQDHCWGSTEARAAGDMEWSQPTAQLALGREKNRDPHFWSPILILRNVSSLLLTWAATRSHSFPLVHFYFTPVWNVTS